MGKVAPTILPSLFKGIVKRYNPLRTGDTTSKTMDIDTHPYQKPNWHTSTRRKLAGIYFQNWKR